MKSLLAPLCLLSLALLLPAAAFADNSQMYKWTDAQGVIHYSDQPPKQAEADVQTLDIPAFPPQDPVKLAAAQAALTQQAMAMQQAEAAQQAQAAALALQQAELQATLAAMQQSQDTATESPPLIYSTSAFVPRAYRTNLFVYHRHRSSDDSRPRPLTTRPAISLFRKP